METGNCWILLNAAQNSGKFSKLWFLVVDGTSDYNFKVATFNWLNLVRWIGKTSLIASIYTISQTDYIG